MSHRKREEIRKQLRGRLIRTLARPPFRDELGRKRWFERFARAQPHLVRSFRLEIDGWPRWSRPMRVVFLSDFHTGSHSEDVLRLRSIVAEARTFGPDLVLLGGDFVNMQPFGGGRVPPPERWLLSSRDWMGPMVDSLCSEIMITSMARRKLLTHSGSMALPFSTMSTEA